MEKVTYTVKRTSKKPKEFEYTREPPEDLTKEKQMSNNDLVSLAVVAGTFDRVNGRGPLDVEITTIPVSTLGVIVGKAEFRNTREDAPLSFRELEQFRKAYTKAYQRFYQI